MTVLISIQFIFARVFNIRKARPYNNNIIITGTSRYANKSFKIFIKHTL